MIDCTVSKYYYDKYKIKLQYPKLQCLQVGKEIKHTYLPIELCNIVGGQRCLKKLTDLQTSAMIKATAKSAPEREKEINKLIERSDFNNDINVQEFGLSVSKNMVKVEGRILPSPKLQYGYNNININNNITNNNDEVNLFYIINYRVDHFRCLEILNHISVCTYNYLLFTL